MMDETVRKKERIRIGKKLCAIRLKVEVFSHYSNGKPQCKCCGEELLPFLTLDHVSGRKDSQDGKFGGGRVYVRLKRNGYPLGYQILCFNCNSGRHINGGVCPHQSYVEETLPKERRGVEHYNDVFSTSTFNPDFKRRERRKVRGLCIQCSVVITSGVRCEKCKEKTRSDYRHRKAARALGRTWGQDMVRKR